MCMSTPLRTRAALDMMHFDGREVARSPKRCAHSWRCRMLRALFECKRVHREAFGRGQSAHATQNPNKSLSVVQKSMLHQETGTCGHGLRGLERPRRRRRKLGVQAPPAPPASPCASQPLAVPAPHWSALPWSAAAFPSASPPASSPPTSMASSAPPASRPAALPASPPAVSLSLHPAAPAPGILLSPSATRAWHLTKTRYARRSHLVNDLGSRDLVVALTLQETTTSWPPRDAICFWPAFVAQSMTPRSRKSGYGLLLGCK